MQHSTGADCVEDTGRVAAKGLISKALTIDTHPKHSNDIFHLYASLPPKCQIHTCKLLHSQIYVSSHRNGEPKKPSSSQTKNILRNLLSRKRSIDAPLRSACKKMLDPFLMQRYMKSPPREKYVRVFTRAGWSGTRERRRWSGISRPGSRCRDRCRRCRRVRRAISRLRGQRRNQILLYC
jgi:hypothetical protein